MTNPDDLLLRQDAEDAVPCVPCRLGMHLSDEGVHYEWTPTSIRLGPHCPKWKIRHLPAYSAASIPSDSDSSSDSSNP